MMYYKNQPLSKDILEKHFKQPLSNDVIKDKDQPLAV